MDVVGREGGGWAAAGLKWATGEGVKSSGTKTSSARRSSASAQTGSGGERYSHGDVLLISETLESVMRRGRIGRVVSVQRRRDQAICGGEGRALHPSRKKESLKSGER